MSSKRDWDRVSRASRAGKILASGDYLGGSRENQNNEDAADQWLKKIRGEPTKKTKSRRTKRSKKKRREVDRQFIVCLDCNKEYTSEDPPSRSGSRMTCKACGGSVCLDHQSKNS